MRRIRDAKEVPGVDFQRASLGTIDKVNGRTVEPLALELFPLEIDGHRWIHDRPWAANNILRVQVDQGGIAKITFTDHPTEPFQFDRRKVEEEEN